MRTFILRFFAFIALVSCLIAVASVAHRHFESKPLPMAAKSEPKPKTIDWTGAWKAAKNPNTTVSVLLTNVEVKGRDGGTFKVYLFDGHKHIEFVAVAAFYGTNKSNFIFSLNQVLNDMSEPPGSNAKIMISMEGDKGYITMEKYDVQIRELSVRQ